MTRRIFGFRKPRHGWRGLAASSPASYGGVRKTMAIALASLCAVGQLPAQQPFVEKPKAPVVWRPYKAPNVPDVVLSNSDRLHSLMRAGRLYLTLQDAIALA